MMVSALPAKLATRCPACSTVFHVSQEQLKMSAGWVRCGRCQEVFYAIDRLFDPERRVAAPRAVSAEIPATTGEVASAAAAAAAYTEVAEAAEVADFLEEDESSDLMYEMAEIPVAQVIESGLPDSAVMELEDSSASDLLPSQFIESDFVIENAQDVQDAAIEDVAILSEFSAPTTVSGFARSGAASTSSGTLAFSDSLMPEGAREAVAAQGPPELEGFGEKIDPLRLEGQPLGLKQVSLERDVPILEQDGGVSQFPAWENPSMLPPAAAERLLRESSSSPHAGAARGGAAAPAEIIHPIPVMPAPRASQGWRYRIGMSALAVALGALLAGQWLYQWRDDLAADHPLVRPVLASLCKEVGCTIEPPKRIHQIAVESSGLTHTGQGDLYQFNVVLRNRAKVPLALPVLDVTLSDGQDNVISRRMLMGAELHASAETIPAQGEMALHTLLATPGKSLVGYTIEVFYP